MRTRSLLLCVAVGLGGWSCSSQPVTVQKKAVDVTGQWYGKLTPTAGSPVDTTGLTDMALKMPAELELTGGRFKLSFGSPPLEGSYKIVGDAITLQPELMMGQPIPEGGTGPLGEAMGEMMAKVKEPIAGNIRDGGKSIFFRGKKDEPGEADMTFTREAPKETTGPKTVTAAAAPFVGKFVFDDSYVPPVEPLKNPNDPKEKAKLKAQQMVRSLTSAGRLSLREDNTFVMDMMARMSGTWKLVSGKNKAKDQIVLKVTEPKEMLEMMGGQMPDMMLLVQSKNQLLMLNDKTGKADTAFKRE